MLPFKDSLFCYNYSQAQSEEHCVCEPDWFGCVVVLSIKVRVFFILSIGVRGIYCTQFSWSEVDVVLSRVVRAEMSETVFH